MSRKRQTLAGLALIAMVVSISACGASAPAAAVRRRRTHRQRSCEGGEVRRVRPQQRCRRIPDPNSSGTVRLRDRESKLAAGPEQRGVAARDRRMQEPRASGVHPTHFTPQQLSARLKFAQCVRANGVPDFPDPTATGPLVDVSNGSSIPGLHAAIQKCIRMNPEAVQ